jgi:hypothetical protein
MRSVSPSIIVILVLFLGNQVLVVKGLLDDSTNNRTRKEQGEEEEEDSLAYSSSSSQSSSSSSSPHDVDENRPITEEYERTNRFLELMHDIVDGEKNKEEEDTRYVVKVSSRRKQDRMTCRHEDGELCNGSRDPSSRNNRCMVG